MYNKNEGWTWRLRDNEEIIAYSGKIFSSSSEAWNEIEKVRVIAASIAGINIYTELKLDEKPSFKIIHADAEDWKLNFCSEGTIVCSAEHFQPLEKAEKIRKRILIAMLGAVKVFIIRDNPKITSLKIDQKEILKCPKCFFEIGDKHRNLLKRTSLRIAVMGVRGKSSTVHRLAEIFTRKGYKTFAKVTGNKPHLILNGFVIPIERFDPAVALYENIRSYMEITPVLESYSEKLKKDVAIIENQAITEYTTRMVNEIFFKPDIVVITNVRQDHLATLGKNKQEIARSFARSVPKGTIVISGEQNEVLSEYMKKEIEKHGSVFKQVEIPPEHKGLLGAETVHALNFVLKEINEVPLSFEELDSYIQLMQPKWLELGIEEIETTESMSGNQSPFLLFNAAEVNDVESTEMIRRLLAGKDKILPFLYLREERRDRSYSFVNYLNFLSEKGYIEEVHLAGKNTSPFARKIKVPTVEYKNSDDVKKVLDNLLAVKKPVILMGNTVDEFMRKMEVEISRRIQKTKNIHYAPEVDTLETLHSSSSLSDYDTT